VISLPDNLYIETAAYYYIDGAVSRSVNMSLWRKESKYKYIVSSNGEPEEIYINDGELEFIQNNITGSRSVPRAANPNFSFENVPHISDINYYLDLIDSGRIIYYNISREIGGNIENIIEINYKIEELDQHEIIQVSLETGLVLSVRTEAGGVLFYRSETTVNEAYFTGEAPDNTAITDNLFIIG
jgi:hypothetical protein